MRNNYIFNQIESTSYTAEEINTVQDYIHIDHCCPEAFLPWEVFLTLFNIMCYSC